MTAPSMSFSEQLLRRRPVAGAPIAHGASDHLKRSIGTFQLTLLPAPSQASETKLAMCLIACGTSISARSGEQDRTTAL